MFHTLKGRGFGLVCVLALWTAVSGQSAEKSDAPRPPSSSGTWSSGIKQGFGTAYEPYRERASARSRVWFTLAQGVVTEVYWPTLDNPQVRDSQILIADGQGFFFDERTRARASDVQVRWLETGVPAYVTTTRDPSGKVEIERVIFTDPERDALIQQIKIRRKVPGLRVYVLHNPSVANTPGGDSARVAIERKGVVPGAGLFAWEGAQAQALIANRPLIRATAGFESQPSDGFQDVFNNRRLTQSFERAVAGNVVMAGEVDLGLGAGESALELVLGFGNTIEQAYEIAQASLRGAELARDQFVKGWRGYQASIKDLGQYSEDGGKLFRASVALLKSMEDKTFVGAFVASPSVPWGQHLQADRDRVGGYHLVWPRDLYQMATTFMAIGDLASARAALDGYLRMQFGAQDGEWVFEDKSQTTPSARRRARDGSFKQNTWVGGETYWGALQMDQVAYAPVLAYRLWKAGALDLREVWPEIARAADFVRDFGPWSQQERWEEAFGASPSTIAAEIAGLWVAAELAHAVGESARAESYRKTADHWASKPGDNIETWMFTTSGGLGNGRYYQRVEGGSSYLQKWNPNDTARYRIANGGAEFREKDVIDGGFLELVRLGVRPAADSAIRDSVMNYDRSIGVEIPGVGTGYRRYTGDRYNYDDLTGKQTDGMLWPLLTGERVHYDLQLALEQGSLTLERVRALPALRRGILTMERMATESQMIPEQVWDLSMGPARAGEPTGSATPLGWSHAEYLKLLRSRADGQVFDRLPIVAQRAQFLRSAGRFLAE